MTLDSEVATLVADAATQTRAAIDSRFGITASTSGGLNVKSPNPINLIGGSAGTANTIAGGGTTSGMAATTPNLPPGSTFINAILGSHTAGVNIIGGGYDNVIDINGAGANTMAGGAHHRITGSGDHNTIGGGSYNRAIGTQYTTIAGGTQNEITGSFGTIGGGDQNKVTNTSGTVLGGKGNTANGSTSTVGGLSSTAGGANSFSVGRETQSSGAQSIALGYGTIAEGTNSLATGYESRALSGGQRAHANGKFVVAGDAQESTIVVKRETTTATTTSSSPNITPQDNGSTTWRAIVVARDVATGDSKAWEVKGLIRRAGTVVTQVGGAPVATVIAADAAASAWGLSTLTGTGSFVFRFTGEAGKTIRWVVRYDTAEVTTS